MNRLYKEESVKDIANAIRDRQGYEGTGKNMLSPNYNDYKLDNGSYGYIEVTDKSESLYLSIYEKDNSVDIKGCFLGFTGNGASASAGVNWILNGGISPVGTQVGNTANNLQYISFYPRNEETFNKIFSRYNIMVRKQSETDNTFEPYSPSYKIGNMAQEINNLPVLSQSIGSDTLKYNAKERLLLGGEYRGNVRQETSILPTEYQQVEYIESTGNQYFNLGKKITPTTKIEMSFLTNKTAGNVFQCLFGSQTLESDSYKKRAYLLLGSINNIQCQFPHDADDILYMKNDGTFDVRTSSTDVIVNNNELLNIIYDVSERSLKVNDYKSISKSTYTLTTTDYNAYLLNRNLNNYVDTNNCAVGKLYKFKWYENNALIMDLIPCYKKSDSVVGLYDLVSNTFFTNVGTGAFLKGNNVILPNPDYKQDVETMNGYQLWDEQYREGVYSTSTGQFIPSGGYLANATPIKVEPTTTYYAKTSGERIYISAYKGDMTYISNLTDFVDGYFTTPNECEYINFRMNSNYGNIYKNNLMISKYNKTYLPYNSIGVKRTGKNKSVTTLDIIKQRNTSGTWNNNKLTYNGITYTINEDLSVLVNGTSTSASYLNLNIDLNNLIPDTEYTLTGCPSGGNVSTYSLRIYKSDGNYGRDVGTGVNFVYSNHTYTRINISANQTISNLLFKPMIRLASETDDTYTPYQERIDQIKLEQENLFDKDNVNKISAYIQGDSIISLEGQTMVYIKIKPNTPYTVYKINSKRFRLGFTDEIPTNNAICTNPRTYDTKSILTSTSGANSKYLCIYCRNSNIDTLSETEIINSIKVVKGTAIYDGSGLLPTDKLEIRDDNHIWWVKNWGKAVLDGTEDWKTDAIGTNTLRFKLTFTQAQNGVSGYCTHNKYVASGVSNDEELMGVVGGNLYFRVSRNVVATMDLTLYKNWLKEQYDNGTPVTVFYPLVTPIEIDLGENPIKTIEGMNNVEILATLPSTYMMEQFIKGTKETSN